VLSAFGIDRGDVKFNLARSLFTSARRFDFQAAEDVLRALEAEGIAYLDRMGVPEARGRGLLLPSAMSGRIPSPSMCPSP
jgi:hypothetical protein